jgi:hypothetical protein
MKTLILAVLTALAVPALAVGDSACTADVHDNTVNINATLNVTAQGDVDHVTPGSSVALTLNASNVYLIAPDQTPPPEHASDAGHIQIYLDDFNSAPILITAQVNVSVTVAQGTPEGHHKLRCRVHKHDGTPTTTESDVDITVTASVGTGDAGTPPSDAGAPPPADAGSSGDGSTM